MKLTVASTSPTCDESGRFRGATEERSLYGPLGNLPTAIGATLRPKLADQGAGHPDFGLYGAKQVQRGAPRDGQTPERGMVEVKPRRTTRGSRRRVRKPAATAGAIGWCS